MLTKLGRRDHELREDTTPYGDFDADSDDDNDDDNDNECQPAR